MTTCHRHLFAFALLALLAAGGCADPQTPSGPGEVQPITDQRGDALAEIGEVTVRASATQTSMLPESVAREYGVKRSPGTLLVLVAVRQGPSATATSLPAMVTATVTDLRGGQQVIAMRQVHSGALVDSIGSTQTTLPDTLRFDLTVAVEGMAPVRMQFQREVYPQ